MANVLPFKKPQPKACECAYCASLGIPSKLKNRYNDGLPSFCSYRHGANMQPDHVAAVRFSGVT